MSYSFNPQLIYFNAYTWFKMYNIPAEQGKLNLDWVIIISELTAQLRPCLGESFVIKDIVKISNLCNMVFAL